METAISPRNWEVPSTRATKIIRGLHVARSMQQREYMWWGITSPGNRLVRTMCMYGSHVMKTLRQKEKYNAKAELDPASQHAVVITKGKMNFFSKNLRSFPFVQHLFYFRF